MDRNIQNIYMQRCLQLAAYGQGLTAPNPMVGALMALNGKIIGEGFHAALGKLHAEPQAIDSVVDKSLTAKATLYVNLEPCNHHGRTPPCTEKIINSGIKKMVVGALDPNPLVAGSGVEKLIKAGIDVQVGIEEKACKFLNRHYYKFQTKKLPFITLKWAESADGFIDNRQYKFQFPPTTKAAKISTPETDVWVHRLRAQHQAILVGYKTVIMDNPQLDARLVKGKSPIIFVFDPNLTIPLNVKILSNERQVVIFNNIKTDTANAIQFVNIKNDVFGALHAYCFANAIQSVLVEGGGEVLNSFIESNCWDEMIRIKSRKHIKKGKRAPEIPNNIVKTATIPLTCDSVDAFRNKNK